MVTVWSHLVKLFIVEVTELHNNGLKGLIVIIHLHNMVTGWSQVVTYGHKLSHLVTLFIVEVTELQNHGLNCLMVKIPLHYMVTGWSHVVTFVTA